MKIFRGICVSLILCIAGYVGYVNAENVKINATDELECLITQHLSRVLEVKVSPVSSLLRM